MVKKYRKVAVGGTFDLLHKGHICLIKRALELGDSVIIGLTSDKMLKAHPKNHPVAPFKERKKVLLNLLNSLNVLERVHIVPLTDPYGPTVADEEVEALIASYETFERGNEINEIRCKRGFKPLKIISIAAILAEDGVPISTTRIRRGDIDSEGHASPPKK